MENSGEKDPLARLVEVTKIIKEKKIKFAPKGPLRTDNKWRSASPKFSEPPQKAPGLVEAGGMEVDPSLKEEYEQWRKAKIEEQSGRRPLIERKPKD